ncbi:MULTISPECIES: universal stress protein [unclassified Streptomyces]|uniref:universal stress protein n=1 Tax=unclassified Streptomyces TaxID=2593676 RepID=UPI00037C7D8F|nr:universal stress protein [Streptomyces sp. HmicA12]
MSTRVQAQLMACPDAPADGAVPVGDVVPKLLSLGEHAGLVVIGVRGAGGYAGLRLGSVAHGVATRCTVPVVLVPLRPELHDLRHRPDKVTVGIDARDPADAALDFALHTAGLRGARLHVLHAWSLPPFAMASLPFAVPEKDRASWEDQEVQTLADVLRPWREKYPEVRMLPDVFLGPAASDALLRNSENAEVLVVGRRRRGRLGRTVRALIEHSRCPVIVVPS